MVSANNKKKYINIMEQMVTEEVNRQITLLPQKLAKYIKRPDVETYALNRLPPLYASSEEGWQFQTKKAEEDYKKQIAEAVRHGFAAVQRDLLKNSTPLFREEIKKASSSTTGSNSKASSSTTGSNSKATEDKNMNENYSWHHSRYYRLGSARK